MNTVYSLPYRVQLGRPAAFSSRGNLVLRLSFSGPVSERVARAASALLSGFEVLASSGALCGREIPPEASGATYAGMSQPGDSMLEFVLADTLIDPAAAPILAQSMLMLPHGNGLQSLSLASVEDTAVLSAMPRVPRAEFAYPGVFRDIADLVRVAPGFSDQAHLAVVFDRQPDAEQAAEIAGRVQSWLAGVQIGLYPIAPLHPEDCTVVCDDDVEIVDAEMQLSLYRFRCDPTALHGFANAVAAAREIGVALRSVEFS